MSSSLQRVIHQAGRVILGTERQIRMALACLLARGHLLIEDVPGFIAVSGSRWTMPRAGRAAWIASM